MSLPVQFRMPSCMQAERQPRSSDTAQPWRGAPAARSGGDGAASVRVPARKRARRRSDPVPGSRDEAAVVDHEPAAHVHARGAPRHFEPSNRREVGVRVLRRRRDRGRGCRVEEHDVGVGAARSCPSAGRGRTASPGFVAVSSTRRLSPIRPRRTPNSCNSWSRVSTPGAPLGIAPKSVAPRSSGRAGTGCGRSRRPRACRSQAPARARSCSRRGRGGGE